MPLKKHEIALFRQRLEELRARIQTGLDSVNKAVTEPDTSKGYSQHQADEGTDDFVKSVNLEVSSKETNMLRQIDRALEKIEEGTYGVCDLTGEEIPMKRLEAIPYATMTVKAQEQIDKGLLQ